MMIPLTQSIFAGGIVNLSVGPNEVPFDAHIELLCALSPFFDKALEGRFDDAETKHIPLPGEDPKLFAEFLSWAYTGYFTFEGALKSVGWIDLFGLWIVGGRFEIPSLQNIIITLLGHKYTDNDPASEGNIPPPAIVYVYESTLDTAPLRRAIIDIAVWGMSVEHLSSHRSSYPKEFLGDYALQQARNAKGLLPPTELPIIAAPGNYFVNVVERQQGTAKDETGVPKPFGKLGVANSAAQKEDVAKPFPYRPKKIPRSVRGASGSMSPRSPSTGAGASSPSPAKTPGTPTPTPSPLPGRVGDPLS